MFLTNRSMLVAKLEDVAYTAETLANADFDIEVENLSWSHNINEFQRKLADGTLDSFNSVMGKQIGNCQFMTPLVHGLTVDVLPRWDKYILACGFKRTTTGGTAATTTSFTFTSGNLVEILFGVEDFSAVKVNSVLVVTGAGNASNNGDFIIAAVDDSGNKLTVYNPGRTDGTDDETVAATATYTPTKYEWTLDSHFTHVPLSMDGIDLNNGVSPLQLVTTLEGAMGNVTFAIGEVGEPIQMNFEFQGSLKSVADRTFANLLVQTGIQTVLPPAVLAADVKLYTVTQCMNQFEINVGNSLQNFTCPDESTGIKGSYIGSRETLLTLDPIAELAAIEEVYNKFRDGTTGALEISVNSTIDLTLSAPAIQHSSLARGDRDEAVTWEKTFRLLKVAGEDSLKITQGAFV